MYIEIGFFFFLFFIFIYMLTVPASEFIIDQLVINCIQEKKDSEEKKNRKKKKLNKQNIEYRKACKRCIHYSDRKLGVIERICIFIGIIFNIKILIVTVISMKGIYKFTKIVWSGEEQSKEQMKLINRFLIGTFLSYLIAFTLAYFFLFLTNFKSYHLINKYSLNNGQNNLEFSKQILG